MLASDAANPAFVGASDPDAALTVQFYLRPVQNFYESSKQGRPIFKDVIFVKINIPGNKDMEVDCVAREDHKARFPRQFQHFMARTEGDAREVGTPLQEWPQITRSQAEELRALKFFTIEAIANAADANLSNIGMLGGVAPFVLREKARAYLAAAKNTALPQHQAEELAKRDAEIALLKEQMAQIVAKVSAPAAQPAPVKRGPGRPKKVKPAEAAPANG